MGILARCAALLLLFGFVAGAAPARRPVAFTHVNVIDTTGGPTTADQTLVVRGSRIEAVGPSKSAKLPPDVEVIDARGKFVIPGLWDMHVHVLWEPALTPASELMIANGVTGARDMHAYFSYEKLRALVVETDSGERVGPRFVYVGHIVDGPRAVWPGSISVGDKDAARKAVRELKAGGAAFVKVYERLPREAYDALVDEARKQGMRLVGHVPQTLTPIEVAQAGQYSIEHLSHMFDHCRTSEGAALQPILDPEPATTEKIRRALSDLWAGKHDKSKFDGGTNGFLQSPDGQIWAQKYGARGAVKAFELLKREADTDGGGGATLLYRASFERGDVEYFRLKWKASGTIGFAPDVLEYDPSKAKALFEALHRNHTWQCPTLITAEAGTFGRDDRFAHDPRAAKYFGPQILSRVGFDQAGRDWDASLKYWRDERRLMTEMVAFGGIEFLAGTDTPVVRNVPGFALHDELHSLVDVGLTPMQALQAGTRNPARFLGREADMGTVDAGKLADLVLLNADPLSDIRNTTKIDTVVADGRLYRRADLDALLSGVQRQARAEREVKLPPAVAPDGTRSGLLDLGGGDSIFYETRDHAGPTLILLHDGLLHRETWNAVWDELAKKYRVIRYDRRGYGLSPPPTQPYSDVDDLRALLNHLKIDKATLIGCSSGGSLAINFTLEHSDVVERLVLIGAVVNGMDFSEHLSQRNAAAFATMRSEGDVSKTIENWVNDRYFVSPANPGAKATLAKLLRDNPHDLSNEHDHWRKQMPGAPALKRLGEIRAATLILVGEVDIPDVHAQAGALQAGIAESRRVVVPGSGHLVFLEKPEAFRRIVNEFLEEK